MSNKIDVLNYGHVRLVDHMGSDLSVVRAARVSYDAEFRTGEDAGKDEKLIDYLMKNRHTSPFESVQFTFEIKAPIFVFRQLHRHRTQSINEVSARYTELPEEFYIPEVSQITEQSVRNKQQRTDEVMINAEHYQDIITRSCEASFKVYHELLKEGVPRELARGVLPMNTYSRMFTSMNLHNLFHLAGLRIHPHAQYEVKVFVEAMLQLIEPIVPLSVAAWNRLTSNVHS